MGQGGADAVVGGCHGHWLFPVASVPSQDPLPSAEGVAVPLRAGLLHSAWASGSEALSPSEFGGDLVVSRQEPTMLDTSRG